MATDTTLEQPTLTLHSEGRAIIALHGDIDFQYMLRHRRPFECLYSRLEGVRHIVVDLRDVSSLHDTQMFAKLRRPGRVIVLLAPKGATVAHSLEALYPVCHNEEYALAY